MSFRASLRWLFFASWGGLLLSSCSDTASPPAGYSADLTHLATVADSIALNLGVWGGAERGKFPAISERGADVRTEADGLAIQIKESGGWLRLAPEAVGLPPSWPRAETLRFTARADRPGYRLIVGLVGTRGRLQDTFELGTSPSYHQLDAREVPILGDLDARVTALQFTGLDTGGVRIVELRVDTTAEPTVLVDRFGQRNLVDYPGKHTSVEELTDDFAREEALLSSLPPAPALDPYGGFTAAGFSFPATGYFRVDRRDGRWFLVSSAGNPFYSLGINGVRLVSTLNNAALTRIAGREHIFAAPPDPTEYAECYREEAAYLSWYCKNVRDKYPDLEDWRTHVLDRLSRIGFNTIGNWSDTTLYGRDMAYTYTLDTRPGNRLGSHISLPDVFDPAWEAYVDSTFRGIVDYRDDPYLLGYFVDNEMKWSQLDQLDSTTHTYAYLARLPDRASRQRAYAERYFGTIAHAIEKYDPNHLYLGCRFTRRLEGIQPVVETAGKYLDVLSLNMYSQFTRAETDAWYRLVNKPILIGEHHVPPVSPSHLLPRYPAFPQAERDSMVAFYLREWWSYPYAVGSHWYQYADQEVSGRGDGGENQAVGLVSVTDRLDPALVRLFNRLYGELPDRYLTGSQSTPTAN